MRASVDVRSHQEGDAIKLAVGHPAIKTASIITGLLLQLPSARLRSRVLAMVVQAVDITNEPLVDDLDTDERSNGNGAGRLHDGTGSTGE